jgi:stage IV sporulation protein B
MAANKIPAAANYSLRWSFLFCNFVIFSLSFMLGVATCGKNFYSYYENQPYLLAPIFLICMIAALAAFIPRKRNTRNLIIIPLLLFPSAFTFVFVLNNLFCLAAVFASFISILFFLPKKKPDRIFEFTSDCDILEVKINLRNRWSYTFASFTEVLLALTFALFIATFLSNYQSKYWNAQLYPIEVDREITFDESAVPGGNVTAALWYGDDTLLVADFFEVDGKPSPCEEAGLEKGDIVTEIDSTPALKSSFITDTPTGDKITLTVLRPDEKGENYEKLRFIVQPEYSPEDDAYRIGMSYYPYASLGATIQTLSFAFPETKTFAATAHSSDGKFEEAGDISAVLLDATVTGRDKDGLTVNEGIVCGKITLSNNFGNFGTLGALSGEAIPIAKKSELRRGRATLLSSFEGGEVKAYNVYINGTYRIDGRDVMTIIIEDERILSAGGVARGMSGSPVIQNGKIIGALSNTDSNGRKAYATFAQDMVAFCSDVEDEEIEEESSTEGAEE